MNYKIEELISMALIKPIKKHIDNPREKTVKKDIYSNCEYNNKYKICRCEKYFKYLKGDCI